MPEKVVDIVIGMGFGDETKGATVDYLAEMHNADMVVRYNGGSQAAHNVVTPEGVHHTFSMFGSGTFAGARTHLSRFVRVDPYVLMEEATKLSKLIKGNPLDLMSIDEGCVVITPFHVAHSQYSASLHKRGTCGMGVGVAARYAEHHPYDALYVGDLRDENVTRRKLGRLAYRFAKTIESTDVIDHVDKEIEQMVDFYKDFSRSVWLTNEEYWQHFLATNHYTILEGAQGVLLDKNKGFRPYVTSSDTTLNNARDLLWGFDGKVRKIGVTRCYATRHGVGTFPTESPEVKQFVNEKHNVTNEYQEDFRVGWFDGNLMSSALSILDRQIDFFAVSHLDCIPNTGDWQVVLPRLRSMAEFKNIEHIYNPYHFMHWLNEAFQIPVGISAFGERRSDRGSGTMSESRMI